MNYTDISLQQGNELKPASPDELDAFYQEMQRQDTVKRQLSKRKSTSIWSRKSKRSSAVPVSVSVPSVPVPVPPPPPPLPPRDDGDKGLNEQPDHLSPMPPISRSIVPDALAELPAWYNSDEWTSPSFYRSKFPMHNPVGPRYYKNYHLLPFGYGKPPKRPPSVFSPSFPPMASSSNQDLSEDATRLAGPSRTPVTSPLPTPSSSQTRVGDTAGKPRSRKTSQTAHDTVDLLDVSDPWGTNWHHGSPYDVGLENGPVSPEVEVCVST